MNKPLAALFISILTLPSFAGCSGGGRVTVQTPPAPGEVALGVAPAYEVTRRVNEGRVHLNEGLSRLHQIAASAHVNDPVDSTLLYDTAGDSQKSSTFNHSGAPTDPLSARSVAEATYGLRTGDPVANIANVLGVTPTPRSLGNLFETLLEREHRRTLKPSTVTDYIPHQDNFLIETLLASNDEKWLSNKKAHEYFLARIDSKREALLLSAWNTLRDKKAEKESEEASQEAEDTLPCDRSAALTARDAKTFNADAVQSLLLREWEIPAELEMQAGEILTEYSPLFDIPTKLSDSDAKKIFVSKIIQSTHLLVHLNDYRLAEEDPSEILVSFADTTRVTTQKHSPTASGGPRKALNLMLTHWDAWGPMTSEFPITTRLLSNIATHGEVLLKIAKKEGLSGYNKLAPKLSLVLDQASASFDRSNRAVLWDRLSTCAPGEKMKRWATLSDDRFYRILRPLRDWTQDALTQDTQRELKVPTFTHPLAEIYNQKAMVKVTTEATPTTQQDLEDRFAKRKEEFRSQMQALSGPPVGLAPVAHPDDARIQAYTESLRTVEFLRHFLDESGLAMGPVMDAEDPRVAIYKNELLPQLDRALNARYEERLKADEADGATPAPAEACLDQKPENKLQLSLCDLHRELEAVRTAGVLELKYKRGKSHLELAPGIFTIDLDTHLTVKSMAFHPLTLIRGYGHHITLDSKDAKIVDPWIDVSSPDVFQNTQQGVARIVPTGVVPETETCVCRLSERRFPQDQDKWASVVEFVPGVAEVCFGIKGRGRSQDDCLKIMNDRNNVINWWHHKEFHSGDYREDEWRHCELFYAKKGSPPPPPPQAPTARSAGTIQLNLGGPTETGAALLVALGGYGVPGFPGGASPNCSLQTNPTTGNEELKYETPKAQNPFLFNPEGETDNDLYDHVRTKVWNQYPELAGRKSALPYAPDPNADVAAGSGGQGGNASPGGTISWAKSGVVPARAILIAPGLPGIGGSPATCGKTPPGGSDPVPGPVGARSTHGTVVPTE